jgi:catechol 2,3-dioxygenase-like lactoylglutathione lyase family enzyme
VKVVGLHHVNINVRDVAEAVAFYTAIGFEELPRPDFGFDGAWLRMGQHELHLMHRDGLVADKSQHFALRVDDLDECAAELGAVGIALNVPPLRDGAGRQAFFRDPSGNLIELNQPAA